jgi:hypothetical protein
VAASCWFKVADEFDCVLAAMRFANSCKVIYLRDASVNQALDKAPVDNMRCAASRTSGLCNIGTLHKGVRNGRAVRLEHI